MKILSLETSIESLESEQKVREVILGSIDDEQVKQNERDISPLAKEVDGLRRQLLALKRQKSLAVRYAESDGVVATVAFKPGEQIPPLQSIVTLTSVTPNLVYGFINENLPSPFNVGDAVDILPLAGKGRSAKGRVVSVGSRIIEFPTRLQTIGNQKLFFGREVLVSIDDQANQIVMGEKVQILTREPRSKTTLGAEAFAESQFISMTTDRLAENLPMEASGLSFTPGDKGLLAVADETGPAGSPFWHFDGTSITKPVNLQMQGLKEIDDVEAITFKDGRYFALTSLSLNKKGQSKHERRLLVRATLENQKVIVDRSVDLRTPLLKALKKLPVMQVLSSELDRKIEVESLTIQGNDAFIALKEPVMPDGSSIILKLVGLIDQLDKGQIDDVTAEIVAILRLEATGCAEPARISDLIKVDKGLFILGNCRRSEKAGGLWWRADIANPGQVSLLAKLQNGRPEGMALTQDKQTVYLVSDNGNKNGADLMKLKVPPLN
jgi:hypothetical protein